MAELERDGFVERFGWTMLVQAAETWQGLWQPWTEVGYYFPDFNDGQRMELVVRTLRWLNRARLIRFFYYPARHDQDPSLVTGFLTPDEVGDLLTAGTQLRVDPSFPDHDDAEAVWFEATEAGIAQVEQLTESQIFASTRPDG